MPKWSSIRRYGVGLWVPEIGDTSRDDRARNSHRHTQVWETTAVRAILRNPRYTGREVWNRARTDQVLIDVWGYSAQFAI